MIMMEDYVLPFKLKRHSLAVLTLRHVIGSYRLVSEKVETLITTELNTRKIEYYTPTLNISKGALNS
jgi:hypothetical protein